MATRGRRQKPHKTATGECILGLYHCRDGRWRITAPGEFFGHRFTEPDEHLAVVKARTMIDPSANTTVISTTARKALGDYDRLNNSSKLSQMLADVASRRLFIEGNEGNEEEEMILGCRVPSNLLWPWLRDQLINKPERIAQMTGLPFVANLANMPQPKPSMKLDYIFEIYQKQNPSTAKSKREALMVWNKLIAMSDAKTLADLTTDTLSEFRAAMDNQVSPATRKLYYGRIKTIIAFGLKVGLDQQQIRVALDRCKVLWTVDALPPVQPRPISRSDFHTLLNVAGKGPWRAWLLLGLNLCMTMEDLCELRWTDFDLSKGTYAAYRVKTRRKRIPRAATLWQETVDVLRGIVQPGQSPYVFTSSHGTRFNRNGRVNEFAQFRKLAGLPEKITFSCLRDGAYTSACQHTNDERQARVLAGHAAAGWLDNYVLRSPEIVRPACEAVFKTYGPFPSVSEEAGLTLISDALKPQ